MKNQLMTYSQFTTKTATHKKIINFTKELSVNMKT